MIARIGKAFSFSNVIACLALFVALGGTVYAAGKLNGKQIKPSSLPGNRLKPQTITARRIKPKTLTGRQVRPRSLTGTQIDQKTLTAVSAAALANVQYVTTIATLPSSGRPGATVTADCPAGTLAIGGGATLSSEDEAMVNDSGPTPLRTGWTATGFSWLSRTKMTVTAVCVVVGRPEEKSGGSITNGPSGPQYQPAG
jgi:hypothetical protein